MLNLLQGSWTTVFKQVDSCCTSLLCCRLAAELSSDDEQHFQNTETRRLQADKDALQPAMLGGEQHLKLVSSLCKHSAWAMLRSHFC
jgi:hypothetical protein